MNRYLEFVAGRCRPNTLRAVAFDLKAFFTVVAKDPVEVTAADVFEFLAHQRGDRAVVRLADPAQMGRFCAHEPWAGVPYCGTRVSPMTAPGLVALADE